MMGSCVKCTAAIDESKADLTADGPVCARCADPVPPTIEVVGNIIRSESRLQVSLGLGSLLLGLIFLSLSSQAGFQVGLRLSIVLIIGGAFSVFTHFKTA